MAKTLKKTKTVKASKARMTRPNVISFRVTDTQLKTLEAVHERDPAFGIKTGNQYARKILCDFLAGRLSWADPADKKKNFDLIGS
jgi:hypothetical protein